MAEQIKSMVEGGKATAGPPLGPALGPLGVNIGQIISVINEKTKEFAGMKVPVTVIVDPGTKEFEVEVGSPPVSALIKKELKLEKGSGSPKEEKVADMLIEQVIKIAKMKTDTLSRDPKAAAKTVVGTCVSMGIMVEGKDPKETLEDIDAGKFDNEIESGKTELTAEELEKLEEEKVKLAEELAAAREEEMKKAQEIIASMEGKERGEIKEALKAAEVSTATINKLLPAEGVAAPVEGAPPEGAPAEAEKAEEKPKEEAKKEEKK